MGVTDPLPVELPTNNSLTRLFYLFVLAPTLLGAAHHIDYSIRGTHVGWPLTPEVNAFTYSLGIYLLLAGSLYLTVTGRVEARYWAGVFAFSAGLLAYSHISPWAVEPPGDVITPYAHPAAGYAALVVLLALIATTVVGVVYGIMLWRRHGARPAAST